MGPFLKIPILPSLFSRNSKEAAWQIWIHPDPIIFARSRSHLIPQIFIFLNLTLTKLSKSHNFSAKRPAPNTPHFLTVSWFFKSNAIFCTVSLQKITVPKVWHHGVGFIKLTVVGFIDPTSPAFRFGWHALPIRVNYENIRVSQIVLWNILLHTLV